MNDASNPLMSPFELSAARGLVSTGMRLLPPTPALGAGLSHEWTIGAGTWTGTQFHACLIAPPNAMSAADLNERIADVDHWASEQKGRQRAQSAAVMLIVPPIEGSFVKAPTSTTIGIISVDSKGAVRSVASGDKGMPNARSVKSWYSASQRNPPISLASVGLEDSRRVRGVSQRGSRLPAWATATHAVIAFIVVVWLLEELATHTVLNGYPTGEQLFLLGGLSNVNGVGFTIWRYATSLVVHDVSSPLHVGFNALVLFYIGGMVERKWGKLVVVGGLAITGVVAGVLWTAFFAGSADTVSFGLSGGIMGLAGLVVSAGRYRSKSVQGMEASSMRTYAITCVVMTLVFGQFDGANNVVHIIGFICGLVLGPLLSPLALHRPRAETIALATSFGIVALGIAAGAIAVVSTLLTA